MNRFTFLIMSMVLLFKYNAGKAQNISGVINNYASVTSISGNAVTVFSVTAFSPGDRILLIQMKGASVNVSNTASFGDIISLGGAGTYEFLTILSISGNAITPTSALTHTYNYTSGAVQVLRVPRYCAPTVINPLTCATWSLSRGIGGVLAFEAGTLTLNADIDVSAKGFGGGNFATSSFSCDNGNYADVAGVNGGKKGESISAYITGMDGLKGKQANGGGAANSGNSGGGGGANAGDGGFGGNQYSGCGSYDDRGIGGASISPSLSALIMGGGGGGGYRDNNLVATPGGNGGGIIYIRANVIISNNHTITANGGSVTIVADAEGAGGGGAGGTIFIECNTISGNLLVRTDGGSGGSSHNSVFVTACHGTGGGGGGGVFAHSTPALLPGTTYSSSGGPAGVITNTDSACFGSTYGATDGTDGTMLGGFPATTLVLSSPTLNIIQTNTDICLGETTSLTASGAGTYSWSTGSTNTTIAVTPTATSAYTLSGMSSGANGCALALTATVNVYSCTGLASINGGETEIKVYPNPTNGRLFIETENNVTIQVYDALGKKIIEEMFQKGNHTLELEGYPAGIYLLKSVGTPGVRQLKIIKTN